MLNNMTENLRGGEISSIYTEVAQKGETLRMGTRGSALRPIPNTRLSKRDDLGPFRLLPNVSQFQVEVGEYDPLFKAHGLSKRVDTKMHYQEHKNRRLNRYIIHQIKRLQRARDAGNNILY